MLSIIVPVFNEEDSIMPFYQRMIGVMKQNKYDYEIIFVNDGSKDKTTIKIFELAQKDKKVKLIDLSRNFGKEIALTAGIEMSTGNAVIPIDVDLQDPPELIPELVKKWKDGFDVVYATRSERKGESFFKKKTAELFYKLIAKMTRHGIPKNTGDFRLMDRTVVDSLVQLQETNRFMKGLFSWVGYNQTGVMYDRDPRFTGKTKWNYFKLLNLAIEGITSFSIVPLNLSSIIGIIISILSFTFGLYLTVKTLIFGKKIAGYPSLMVVITFLGGIQLITIGILGEYIGRIYMEVKKRPLYIIRNKINFKK